MKGGADGGLKVGWRRELGQREFWGIDEKSEAFSCPYTEKRNYIIFNHIQRKATQEFRNNILLNVFFAA